MALEAEDLKEEVREGKNEVKGGGKDRVRDKINSAPPSKVIIRRLPPTMTKDQFMENVSPLPDYDYLNYVLADFSLGQNAFCTAYVNFLNQEDIFIFKDKFDGYVFLDAKGNEFPAVVEFAPFQKIPKKRTRRDVKCGTIEQDVDYKAFLEALQNPAEVSLPGIDTYLEEIETKERQLKANHGVPLVKTPLLEYVKQRKLEKQRIREEKREERRRRELERRKQREEERRKRKLEREKRNNEKSAKEKSAADSGKESKTDNSDSEAVVKVLKNPERKATSTPHQSKKSERNAEHNEAPINDNHKSKSFRKKSDKVGFKEDDKYRNKNTFGKNDAAKSDSGRKAKERYASNPSKDSKFVVSDKAKNKPLKSQEGKKSEIKDDALKKANSSKDEYPENENFSKSSSSMEEGKQKTTKMEKVQTINKSHSNEFSKVKEGLNNDDESGARDKAKNDRRIKNKDRPSMELYRPGGHRLVKGPSSTSPNKEVCSSSSSSTSPSPTLQSTTKIGKSKETASNEQDLDKKTDDK